MASALDKSLDDIIATKPKTNRRRRGAAPAKAAVLGTRNTGAAAAATRATRTASLAKAPAAATTAAAQPALIIQQGQATKIIVSNLPLDVNEVQIKELFTQTVGQLKEVNLNYDSRGHSKGIAQVTFHKKGDGFKAYKDYNNRLIDGKRPMKIELVLEPVKAPPPSLASRVAPAPAAAQPAAPRAAPNGHTGAPSGRRGRGRGGRGRGAGRTSRPAKSAADLDQEMEDYSTVQEAPAAAPTAAA